MVAAGLIGCGRGAEEIGRTAESLRTSTEQMASASKTKSNAREARIMADAIEIEERQLAKNPDADTMRQRYEVRRDGSGWSVYDVNSGQVARKGAVSQGGLSRSNAAQAAWEMQLDEDEARYRQALTNAVR